MHADSPTVSPLPPGIQRAMRVLMVLGWLVPVAAFALVALFAPDDALHRWPNAAKAVSWVQAAWTHLIPSVDYFRHARSTAFPEAAAAATAVALVAWPWMAAATFAMSIPGRDALRAELLKLSAGRLLLSVALLPAFGLLATWAFFSLPGDPGFARGLTTSGRAGYTFMGTLSLVFGGFGIGYFPIVVATFITKIFRRNQHG